MSYEDKAVAVVHNAPGYRWSQLRTEVRVVMPVPDGTRGKQILCTIQPTSLSLGIKGQAPVLDGPLFGSVKPSESLWTVEDEDGERVVSVVLTKAKEHESWTCIVQGKDELDALTEQEMKKAMMLEKFHNENPGFDFSGAEFTGQVPDDPANFGKQS